MLNVDGLQTRGNVGHNEAADEFFSLLFKSILAVAKQRPRKVTVDKAAQV